MSKLIKQFFCNSCGHNSPKWEGKCPSCGAWNSLHEEVVQKSSSREEVKKIWRPQSGIGSSQAKMIHIDQVQSNRTLRMKTVDEELNRVLGGGIVNGSLILVGGEPGIGKSTLMLQVAMQFDGKVLYVSGEESEEQIKMRADRIMQRRSDCYLLSDTNLTQILVQASELRPSLIIIDSIQTIQSQFVDSAPGSVSQVRESAAEIQRFAKEMHIPVFIIGHVTKDGSIAGPRLLEHIVDVVLNFEGERHSRLRLIRAIKNRFGASDEVGCFDMTENGITSLPDPTGLFTTRHSEPVPGTCVTVTLEGRRPLLAEIQALVGAAVPDGRDFGNSRRVTSGLDNPRTAMTLAVLELRANIRVSGRDVYVATVGGMKISEPAADLAVALAVGSAAKGLALPADLIAIGEVGLAGEIRKVTGATQRIAEAARLGFKRAMVPAGSAIKIPGIEIMEVARLEQAIARVKIN